MKKTICAADYQKKFLRDIDAHVSGLVWREDGAIYPDHVYQNMIGPDAACELSFHCAVAFHMTNDAKYAEYGKKLLNYAGRSLICWKGVYYWGAPTPSLCSMGRWIREAIYAAKILQDADAFAWLDKMLSAWPYEAEHHCFVERFAAGTHDPTSVNGFLRTFNMICEGTADAWMVAKQTRNDELLEKARDTLCHYILPGQREDGLWNYHSKREVDMGLLNDGETEYNYNLYLLSILINFLLDDEGRALVQVPLERSFRVLYTQFHFSDGSAYMPVHWGWDHIYESTLLSAEIAWHLYHWCGMTEYEPICARALHWITVADLGSGNRGGGMSCVGLCWHTHFLTMMADDFCVCGDVAETSEIIQTLQTVEQKIAVIPADIVHRRFYYSLHYYESHQAIQRKIMRLQHPVEQIHIPHTPEKAVYSMPWYYPQTGYAGTLHICYDEKALYLTVQTDCKEMIQPYTQATLFHGDGILLEMQNGSDAPCRISLAVENGKPVVFRYNPKLPFAGDLRLYLESEPRGWYLENSTLRCESASQGLCYTAEILWEDLGLHPQKGTHWQGGISINRYTRCSVQFNQIGRTAMETEDRSYGGAFVFD